MLTDLRLTVSYRTADDLPWEVVDEVPACAFDSELPLTPDQTGTRSVDLAFEFRLSSAVPAGAEVRVRAEALDSAGGGASRHAGADGSGHQPAGDHCAS